MLSAVSEQPVSNWWKWILLCQKW